MISDKFFDKHTFNKIKQLQKFTNLIILRLSFARVVRDVLIDIDLTYQIQSKALEVLQKATKLMITTKFQNKRRAILLNRELM